MYFSWCIRTINILQRTTQWRVLRLRRTHQLPRTSLRPWNASGSQSLIRSSDQILASWCVSRRLGFLVLSGYERIQKAKRRLKHEHSLMYFWIYFSCWMKSLQRTMQRRVLQLRLMLRVLWICNSWNLEHKPELQDSSLHSPLSSQEGQPEVRMVCWSARPGPRLRRQRRWIRLSPWFFARSHRATKRPRSHQKKAAANDCNDWRDIFFLQWFACQRCNRDRFFRQTNHSCCTFVTSGALKCILEREFDENMVIQFFSRVPDPESLPASQCCHSVFSLWSAVSGIYHGVAGQNVGPINHGASHSQQLRPSSLQQCCSFHPLSRASAAWVDLRFGRFLQKNELAFEDLTSR